MAIDLIYEEVCGPANVVTLDPYRTNRFTIVLCDSVPVAEVEWFAVD
jgi:hypothetical protein